MASTPPDPWTGGSGYVPGAGGLPSAPPDPAMANVLVRPRTVNDAVSLAYGLGVGTMVLGGIYLMTASLLVDVDHIPLWLAWLPVAQFVGPAVLIVGGSRLNRGYGRAAYLTGLAVLLAVSATYLIPPVLDRVGPAHDHAIPSVLAATVAGCSILGMVLVLRPSVTKYLRLMRAARSRRW